MARNAEGVGLGWSHEPDHVPQKKSLVIMHNSLFAPRQGEEQRSGKCTKTTTKGAENKGWVKR